MYSSDWVRAEMMALWKNTFHDDDRYIELVFDTYFDYGYVEYEVREGRMVSAMLGVPYRFGGHNAKSYVGHDEINGDGSIRGLYLCGLATSPEYRRQGIMQTMLRRMEAKAKHDGFSFVFLIPADNGLRKYYGDRGYFDASYRIPRRYMGIHDFSAEYANETSAHSHDLDVVQTMVFGMENHDALMTSNHGLINMKTMYDAFHGFERNRSGISVLHTEDDFAAIVEENIVSGGSIIVAYSCNDSNSISDSNKHQFSEIIGDYDEQIKHNCCDDAYKNSCGEMMPEIKGLLFVTYGDNGDATVVDIMCDSRATYYGLMSAVSRCVSDKEIKIYRNEIEKNRDTIWTPCYVGEGTWNSGIAGEHVEIFDEAKLAEPYAMMKILNLREILKFADMGKEGSGYSFIVKTDESEFESVSADNDAGRSVAYVKYTIIAKGDNPECNNDIAQSDLKSIFDVKVDVMSHPSQKEKGEAVTEQEVGCLLFRRSAIGSDSLKELLGLPSVRFIATLLLD